MTQDERESFGLPRFRRPLGAVPAANGKIAPRVVFQEVAEKCQAGEGNGIWGGYRGWGHELLLFCSTNSRSQALPGNAPPARLCLAPPRRREGAVPRRRHAQSRQSLQGSPFPGRAWEREDGLVPRLCLGTHCPRGSASRRPAAGQDADRPDVRSHAERGNEGRCTRTPELLSTRPTRPFALSAVSAGASSAGAARNTVPDSAEPTFPGRS